MQEGIQLDFLFWVKIVEINSFVVFLVLQYSS